jgi:AcrR family transcriptional regulator
MGDGRGAVTKVEPAADRLRSMARDPSQGTRRDGERELPLGARARRTRAALLVAAWEEFSEKGYRATQPADIAARAGASVGTFYQYFRSRSDVMSAVVGSALRTQLATGDQDWHVEDGVEGVRRMVHGYVTGYQTTASFHRAWEEATHADEELAEVRRALSAWLVGSVEAGMRRGVRRGHVSVPEGFDIGIAARALAGMLDRYCYLTYVFDPPDPAPTLEASVGTLTQVWVAALGLDRVGPAHLTGTPGP